jgi:deoxyuridine 5'-triphosphate nucleotidohydrolase
MSSCAEPHFVLQPDASALDLYVDIPVAGGERGDSGTDLRFPHNMTVPPMDDAGLPTIINLLVRGRCYVEGLPVPYQIVPRSSLGKSPLTLANSVGTIDRGYVGDLKVAVRNHSRVAWPIDRGASLFQLVRPDLAPATVSIADEYSSAFTATARGAGGFGSTGAGGTQ